MLILSLFLVINSNQLIDMMEGTPWIPTSWVAENLSPFEKQYICDDHNGPFLGVIDHNIQKQFEDIGAHYELQISLDLLFNGRWEGTSYLKIQIDSANVFQYYNVLSSSTFQTSNNYCKLNSFNSIATNQNLITELQQFTHDKRNPQIKIIGNFGCDIVGQTCQTVTLKNLIIRPLLCHFSCLTCYGPNIDNCNSCPNGSPISGQCYCPAGQYQYQNKCVLSCSQYYISNIDNQCILQCSLNCQSCGNTQCNICEDGYFKHLGQCVQKCPHYSQQIDDKNCLDYSEMKIYGSEYIVKAFYTLESDYFYQSNLFEFSQQFDYSMKTGQKYSIYKNQILLGGFSVWSEGYYSYTYYGLSPHNKLRVYLDIWFIDEWNNEKFYILVDGINVYTIQTRQIKNLFYGNQLDSIESVALEIDHISDNLNIRFVSELQKSSYIASVGITNIFILIDYCDNNCQICANTQCQICIAPYQLINNKCVLCDTSFNRNSDCSCIYGYFEQNQAKCIKCKDKCETCIDEFTCINCKNGSHLLNIPLCDTCEDGYYYDDATCLVCKYNCQSCKTFNQCITCAVGFVNPPNCECQQGYYENSIQICVKCSYQCKTCKNEADICTTCPGNRISLPDCSCPPFSIEIANSAWCTTCTIASLDIQLIDKKIVIHFFKQLKQLYSRCSHIFKENTLQQIGEDAICTQESSQIIIQLGQKANINPIDEIQFNSNIISFMNCQEYILAFYNTKIRILSSSDSPQTQFIFTEDTIYLSRCSKEQIEISYIQNDKVNYKLLEWKLISSKNDDIYINDFIDTLNKQIKQNQYRTNFQLPQDVLGKENEIEIQLLFLNFMNQQFQTQIKIFQKIDAIITQIEHQSVSYKLSQDILVRILSYKCPKSIEFNFDTSVNYIISLNGQLHQYDSNLDTNFIFSIKAIDIGVGIYSMGIQTLYKEQIVQFLNYQVSIIEEPQHLVIHSYGTAFYYKSEIILKAELIGSREQVQIQWECYDISYEKLCEKNSKIIDFGQENKISIPSETFLPFQIIIISAIYQNLRESIQIQIVEIEVPQLNTQVDQDIYLGYINYYDSIDVKLNFKDVSIDPDKLQYVGILYTTERVIAQFNFHYLELKLQIWDYITLIELTKKLTLKLSIHNLEYFLPSTQIINIYLNIPPQNCKLNVYPLEGDSMLTDFTISINDCDDENKPLQYRLLLYQNYSDLTYDYQQGQLYKGLILYDYQWDNVYNTKLVGNGQIYLLIQAMDVLKGISNYTTNLTVKTTESLQLQNSLTGHQDLKTSILYVLNQQNNNETTQQSLQTNQLASSICDCEQDVNQQLYLKKLLLMQGAETTPDLLYQELVTSKTKLSEIERQLNQQTNVLADNIGQTNQQFNQVKLQEQMIGYAQYVSELFNQNQKLIKQNRRFLEEEGETINQQVLASVETISNIQLNKQTINGKKKIVQTNGFNITTQKVTSKLLQQAFGSILSSQSARIGEDIYDGNEQQQDDVKSTIFEYKMIKFTSNPYYYDEKFQELNKNNSNNIVYQPQVKFSENQSLLQDSQNTLQYEFPKQIAGSYQQCVMNFQDSWSVDACKTKDLGNRTICECQKISIVTLIDALQQLGEEFTQFFSIRTLEQISECNYEEFLFLYIVIFFTIVLLIFLYYGDKMDQVKLSNGSFHSAKIAPQSWEELQEKRKSSSINEIAQIESERNQLKTTKETKRTSIHIQKEQNELVRQPDSALSSKRSVEGKVAEETEGNNPLGLPNFSQSQTNSPKQEESILFKISNKSIKIYKGFFQYYKISHNLLSLYFLYSEKESRLYRAIIAYLSIIGEMCILIFFGEIISLNTIIALSILQSIFGLIFSKIFSYLIHNKNIKLKILGSVLAVLCILFFYFLLLGSLARYKTILEAQYWALAYLSSFILNYIAYSLIVQFTTFTLIIRYGKNGNFQKLVKYVLDEKVYEEVFGKPN